MRLLRGQVGKKVFPSSLPSGGGGGRRRPRTSPSDKTERGRGRQFEKWGIRWPDGTRQCEYTQLVQLLAMSIWVERQYEDLEEKRMEYQVCTFSASHLLFPTQVAPKTKKCGVQIFSLPLLYPFCSWLEMAGEVTGKGLNFR